MIKNNEFDYVNRCYGLQLKKGSRVKDIKKNIIGIVAKGEGQYIYILWDGDLKHTGPYHPTSDLEYIT
jgi:hypothetical protein